MAGEIQRVATWGGDSAFRRGSRRVDVRACGDQRGQHPHALVAAIAVLCLANQIAIEAAAQLDDSAADSAAMLSDRVGVGSQREQGTQSLWVDPHA